MSAKEYFQRDAERDAFYRTFYQICRRFNVTWSTATPEVRAFIFFTLPDFISGET